MKKWILIASFAALANAQEAFSYLDFFADIESSRALTEKNLQALEAEKFEDRARGVKALQTQPYLFPDLLRPAYYSTDPEVFDLARSVAKRVVKTNRSRMFEAIHSYRAGEGSRQTEALLNLLPWASQCNLGRSAHQALLQRIDQKDTDIAMKATQSSNPKIRVAGYDILGRVGNGNKVSEQLSAGWKDPDHHVKLAVATAYLNQRDEQGVTHLKALAKLENLPNRPQAVQLLQRCKGPATEWALPFDIPLIGIRPFNGKDFRNWICNVDGKREEAKEYWSVKEGGIMHYNGRRKGDNAYLLTEETFTDYTLFVEWRWLQKGPENDSGIYVTILQDKHTWPEGCEVNLNRSNFGQLWFPGGFKAESHGENSYNAPARKPSSEKPFGEWNTAEVQVTKHEIHAIINGVPLNNCKADLSKPGRVGLQMSEFPVDFRNLIVIPNE